MEPIYKKIGLKYKNAKDTEITKMDGMRNEVRNVHVDAFPTIKLYRSGDNKEITFNEDRTFDNLVNFIEQNRGTLVSKEVG